MSYTILGGNVQTRQVKLSDTNPTVIVDGGSSGAIVIGVYAAAIASTPSLTLEKYSGGVSYYLRYQKAMTANEEYSRDLMIVLKNGEQLRATASAADSIDVLATYIPGDKSGKG